MFAMSYQSTVIFFCWSNIWINSIETCGMFDIVKYSKFIFAMKRSMHNVGRWINVFLHECYQVLVVAWIFLQFVLFFSSTDHTELVGSKLLLIKILRKRNKKIFARQNKFRKLEFSLKSRAINFSFGFSLSFTFRPLQR